MLSQSEKIFLFGSYVFGFLASVYIGMQLAYFRMKKVMRRIEDTAYNRGFKAGKNFNNRVKEAQLDVDSAVRILEGRKQ